MNKTILIVKLAMISKTEKYFKEVVFVIIVITFLKTPKLINFVKSVIQCFLHIVKHVYTLKISKLVRIVIHKHIVF